MRDAHKSGFTMVEALVGLVLTAVGVVGALNAISSLALAQSKMQRAETLQSLAMAKHRELVSTQDYANASDGDFRDHGLDGYSWRCEVESTSYEGATVVRVTAIAPGRDGEERSVVSVVYEPTLESEEAP